MRKKKFMPIILAVCMLLVIPAYAADLETGSIDTSMPDMGSSSANLGTDSMPGFDSGFNTSFDTSSMQNMDMGSLDMSGFSLNQDINSLAKSNGMSGFGEGLDMDLDMSKLSDTQSADEYFKKTLGDSYKGINSNLSSISMPEGISFESLNTQYANLQMDFSNNKKELSTDVTLPSFNGYSGDSTKIFKESFGDIADSMKITSYSIPKSFDPNNMLTQMQKQKNDAFSTIKSSSAFTTVNKNLTHGEIFQMAKSGIDYKTLNAKTESFGLKDIGSISKDVNKMIGTADKKNKNAYNSSKNKLEQQNSSQKAAQNGQFKDYPSEHSNYFDSIPFLP